VTPSELRVRRVSHRGHVVEWVLNPLWVRLDQKTHAEFGIERLYLVSRGRRVSVASFLGPDEKASFAKALLLRCRPPSAARPTILSRVISLACRKSGGLERGCPTSDP
jgi:hypothetical protein